jgi:hypothetical protein
MIRLATPFAAALALALLSAPLAAQTAPPAPPASAAAEPSASHLAVAREVAKASGLARSIDAVVPELFDQLKQSAVTRPELTKDLDEVLVALGPEMEKQKLIMSAQAARVFARHLTEAELKEIAAFFNSPIGQKYVSTQPVILDGVVRELQNWTETVSEYVVVRVRAEMSKRGHQL